MLADLAEVIREYFLEARLGSVRKGTPNDPPEPLSYQFSGMSFRSRAERYMLRESRRYPALSTAPPSITSRTSDTGD